MHAASLTRIESYEQGGQEMYYQKKLETLKDIFGVADIQLGGDHIRIGDYSYPVIEDVIILLPEHQLPESVRVRIKTENNEASHIRNIEPVAEDIQFTFGEEWKRYNKLLSEHESEFTQYFDLIDMESLRDLRVCDLGCGIGRWSYHLQDKCREIILVDFSEAIFVARRNLSDCENAIYFMGDIRSLPFRDEFADFIYCLGVLHHLPSPALEEVRSLKRYAPEILIYLYYALDNRPRYYKWLLALATVFRSGLSRVRNPYVRSGVTRVISACIYYPMIKTGHFLEYFGLGKYIPLYEGYRDKSNYRIRQDVYDRFFTRIEQRFTREQIAKLSDTYSSVDISDGMPYWHFRCRR